MTDNIILSQTTKERLVAEILRGVKELIQTSNQTLLTQKEWLTSKEVQKLLKISPVTLWKYDKEGLTKPQKIGSRKRYHKPDILSLLEARETRKS